MGRAAAGQPWAAETPGGALPFSQSQRARSESSFTELRCNNLGAPAAGVSSSRSHHHYSKECTAFGQAQRDSDATFLHMDEARKVNLYRPASRDATSRFDGRRMDPAVADTPAGAPCYMTAHLGNGPGSSEELPAHVLAESKTDAKGCLVDSGFHVSKMNIEHVPHKKLFDPPARDVIRHVGDPSDPSRAARRQGYDITASKMTFTWNECGEQGFSPKVPVRSMTEPVHRTLSMTKAPRMYTSCRGEKQYQICGNEDLREAATSNFVKSDVLPSARHVFENNRNELNGFEFKDITPRVAPKADSTGMWGCLNWSTQRQWEPPEQNTREQNNCSLLASAEIAGLGEASDFSSSPIAPSDCASPISPSRSRAKRSPSVPTSRSSRTSTATGASAASRASSCSSFSRSALESPASRRRRCGTPTSCRSSSFGSGSSAMPKWR